MLPELPEDITSIQNDNEDCEKYKDDIINIREWLDKHPDIKIHKDDRYILSFFKNSQFDREETKSLIERFYKIRKDIPDLFTNRDPFLPKMQEILNLGLITLLNCNDDSNGKIYFLERLGVYDTKKFSIWDRLKINFMLIDILTQDCRVSQEIIFIVDAENFYLNHVAHYTPYFLIKLMSLYSNTLPVNISGIYVVNTSRTFGFLISFCKKFLPAKLKNLIHAVNRDYKKLYEKVPKTILPNEYGGEAGPLNSIIAENKTMIESYSNWFIEDEKLFFSKNES